MVDCRLDHFLVLLHLYIFHNEVEICEVGKEENNFSVFMRYLKQSN